MECLKHPEEIDVKELKNPLFAGQSVFSAYKWDNPDAQLRLRLIKPDYEAVPDCIVRYAKFQTVYTLDRLTKNLYTLFIQNNGRQFLRVRLPDASTIYSLEINGQKERFSKPDPDGYTAFKIPPQSESTYSVLRLQFETAAAGSAGLFGGSRLKSPEISEVNVSRLDWELYLPSRLSYLWFGGNAESVGGRYSYYDSGYEQKVRQQSFQIDSGSLETSGKRFLFTRLASSANLSFLYISEKFYSFLLFLLFLGTLYWLFRRKDLRLSIKTLLAALLLSFFFDKRLDSIKFVLLDIQVASAAVIGLLLLHRYRDLRKSNPVKKEGAA
ncbi:MAG: hypothetical protein PHW04_07460 [Candidatus Wallbacteria bacterium]|nr:hypothetical protein [Candidatus Wallbacteria bacterium]